jgi:hypothetical protein
MAVSFTGMAVILEQLKVAIRKLCRLIVSDPHGMTFQPISMTNCHFTRKFVDGTYYSHKHNIDRTRMLFFSFGKPAWKFRI